MISKYGNNITFLCYIVYMSPIIYGILAILLIVIIYYLYIYISTASPVLLKTVDLNTSKPHDPIQPTDNNFKTNSKDNTQFVTYTYSVWIYINTLSTPIGTENTLFKFGKENNSYFKLYLDSNNQAILNVDISCNTNIKTVTISNSFPLQKWTNVIISVDKNFIDIYQDGKLSLSSSINKPGSNNIVNVPEIGSGIQFGKKQDITLGNLMRLPYPIDPGTAYNIYLQGNGQPSDNAVALKLWSTTGDSGAKNILLST